MDIEEIAKRHNLSTLELFKRAYAMYGLMFGSGGHQADHAWWKKWKTPPLYVAKYCRYLERRVAVVNGHSEGE